MRTVLIGSDFMYNQNGDLVPIEINTNLDMNRHMVENINDVFDLTQLTSFISENNFTGVTYIGALIVLNEKINDLCIELGIPYNFYKINGSTLIPNVDDNEFHLIIRSAYDESAVVDSEYCKNKVNFLNLIEAQTYSTEFAYLDINGGLVNNFTNIVDNGTHPNLIMKAIYPTYDINEYPKFFRVTNITELNNVLSQLDSTHFLMTYHFNSTKLYENHIQVFRSFNLLFPPNLESFSVGQYTRLTTKNIDELSTYNPTTFELNYDDRIKYVTNDSQISAPKLLDTDKVEMADGTFKTALELEVGDMLKTIDIPNPNNISLADEVGNFNIDYQTFLSGSTFSTNMLMAKIRVEKLVNYVTMTFTDGTTWQDTENSSYLIVRNNVVRFVLINNLVDSEYNIMIGDQVILIDTTNETLTPVLKEVQSVTMNQQFFGGWELTVERRHLFLTQTSDNTSFVSIEHNIACLEGCNCNDVCNCPKGYLCNEFLVCSNQGPFNCV